MEKKVLVVNRLEQKALTRLKKHVNVIIFKGNAVLDNPDFRDALQDAIGITGLGLPVNEALLQAAPMLQIVSNVSVGYNNLDLEKMTEYGVMGTNTPDVLTDTVADLIFGLLLATARRIPELDRYVKSNKWVENLPADYYGIDVHHKTIGIIGLGRIGEAIAHRAHHGFHMDVLYHNRTRKLDAEKNVNATYSRLDGLLSASDFVVLMTPLTEETKGLIGAREFSLMKQSAIFINGSRGQTVIEKDLIAALESGTIKAAGLDVFEKEPLEMDNPLLNMPQVVTLPHIGSSTYATELAMSELAVDNLLAGLKGERPKNLLNEGVLGNMPDSQRK